MKAMTKREFMTLLSDELRKRKITDTEDIIEEYEQHFAFKLADGFSEEEIAARLGDPADIAAQFNSAPQPGAKPSAVTTWLWIVWSDLFFGIFAVLLLSFGIVLAACVLSFGVTGVCLIADISRLPFVTFPEMPYWCGAILGISLLALCTLSVAGCIWYFAFYRQIFRSYGRFHRNALASAKGEASLPALPVSPRFSAKNRRRLRSFALISLALFVVCFVLSFIACCLSAGSLQFWHTWGWFMN